MKELSKQEIATVVSDSARLIAVNLDKLTGGDWAAIVLLVDEDSGIYVGSCGLHTDDIRSALAVAASEAGDIH